MNNMVEKRSLGLKGARRVNEQRISPICNNVEDWSNILRCGGNMFGGARFWTRG
jgi:hypothetical protein